MTVAAAPQIVDPAALRSGVFISYRRADSSYLAAWIHERLSGHLGADRVFLDIDSIRPAIDFFDAIEVGIRRSSALVLLIGACWAEGAERMLTDARDPVRFEIEIALEHRLLIFPVLLDGAGMPDEDELPESIRRIARLNAVRIRRESARDDIRRLEACVAQAVGEQWYDREPPDAPPVPEVEPVATTGDKRLASQRRRLARQLRTTYADYLAQVFVGSAALRFPLGLSADPRGALRPAARIEDPAPPRAGRAVEVATLLDAFVRFGGLEGDGLVLLGEPGSGKSTLLFELGAQLTERALHDEGHPLPVYLPLGGWSGRRGDLPRWLVAQLATLYQIPPELAALWMVDGQLLFLFDGLDEISDASARQACVDEINRLNRFGRRVWIPSVTACRANEFDMLARPVFAEAAVTVLPLEPREVLEALRHDPGADGLFRAVDDDPRLLDLLRSPLLLGMLDLTFGLPAPAGRPGAGDASDDRASSVVATYVAHRMDADRRRRGGRGAFTARRTRRWLSALAGHLRSSGSAVFLMDQLRPEWLPSRAAARLVAVAPLTLWGMFFGLARGVAIDFGRSRGILSTVYLIEPVVLFGVLSAVGGSVIGLVAGRPARHRAAAWVGLGLLGTLTIDLTTATSATDARSRIVGLVILAIEAIATNALLGEIASRLIGGHRPVLGRLRLSWRNFRRGIVTALASGVLLAAVLELTNWIWVSASIGRGVLIGSVSAVVFGLLFALSSGLARGLEDTSIPTRIRPNDGVRRSLRYGLTVGAVATVVIGTLFLLAGSVAGWEVGVARAIQWGPGGGLLWGLATGLAAVVQYYVLRVMLWRYGLSPLRLGRWLEHMVELRILYRTAGGGYAFIHQLVADHFRRPV